MPSNRTGPMIGKGHLALILLGNARGHFFNISNKILAELSYEIGEEFRSHLPIILQLVFLGFDSPQLAVYEHSRILLLNLIYNLVVEKLGNFHGRYSKIYFFYD